MIASQLLLDQLNSLLDYSYLVFHQKDKIFPIHSICTAVFLMMSEKVELCNVKSKV